MKYIDPDGRYDIYTHNGYINVSTGKQSSFGLSIEIQRGIGNANFNDTFNIFYNGDELIHSNPCHGEKYLDSDNPIDFTLPAGDYSARISDDATNFNSSLRISSESVINPVTGEPGIPEGYGFMAHPNEITRETTRESRAAEGRSNGPFNSPQGLGCPLFSTKEEYNEMMTIFTERGYGVDDIFKMRINDAE